MSVSLGLGPKKPKQRGWNPVPPLRRTRPHISLPPIPLSQPPDPSLEQGCDDGTGAKQGLGLGQGVGGGAGDCCCPGQVTGGGP